MGSIGLPLLDRITGPWARPAQPAAESAGGRSGSATVQEAQRPGRSHWIDLGGPTHYVDYGGSPDGPVLVAVHGLGGSAINWDLLALALTPHVRLLAVDLPGHGLTPGMGRSTDVHTNQQLVDDFVEAVVGGPVVVMGNSMGALIAVLQATQNPGATRGLILISPALPLAGLGPTDLRTLLEFGIIMAPGLGRLTLGAWERFASAEMQVERMLRKVMVDPASLPEEAFHVARQEALTRRHLKDTAREMVEATRSVIAVTHTKRYARQLQALRMPVMLLHGSHDKVVAVRSAVDAASRNPHWDFQVFHGVGHVPQIEAPARSAEAILGWLAAAGIEGGSVDLRDDHEESPA